MYRDNVWFLTKQFRKLLVAVRPQDADPTSYRYIFVFSEIDQWRNDIDWLTYRRYLRGDFTENTELSFKEICEQLVFEGNTIPLWIKMTVDFERRIFHLVISKRFREKKVIEDWHKENEFMPIILPDIKV